MPTSHLRRIAVAACRPELSAPPTELYPNPEWPPLHEAFASIGVEAVQVAWDDPAVDWSRFEAVMLRSTWDSVDRPDEFLAWAQHVDTAARLVNPLTAVRWNLDKSYLAELRSLGVDVVPTQFVRPDERWETPTSADFVVKPSVSAGGRETARYRVDEAAAARLHVDRLQRAGQTVMVQNYLPSVDDEGETKLVFIGGTYSHAIRASALLRPSTGVVERPWQIDTFPVAVTPTSQQLLVAEETLRCIEERLGSAPSYARIDLVSDPFGSPLVLETELIDPLLFLSLVPTAAPRLAQVVLDAAAL
jgi:hypothetical protein